MTPTEELKELATIRTKCQQLFELGQADKLDYWTLDFTKEDTIVDFVCSLILRDYGTDYDSIPPHGRWRHFLVNGKDRISPLLEEWKAQNVDKAERCKRLLDLFVISVLLDAGAGDVWKFKEKGSEVEIGRSEGLALASLEMWKEGLFSASPLNKTRVDGKSLLCLRNT